LKTVNNLLQVLPEPVIACCKGCVGYSSYFYSVPRTSVDLMNFACPFYQQRPFSSHGLQYLFVHAPACTFQKLLIRRAFSLFLIWGKAARRATDMSAPSIPAYTFLQKQSFYSLYIMESNCVDNSVASAVKYRNFWLIGLNSCMRKQVYHPY